MRTEPVCASAERVGPSASRARAALPHRIHKQATWRSDIWSCVLPWEGGWMSAQQPVSSRVVDRLVPEWDSDFLAWMKILICFRDDDEGLKLCHEWKSEFVSCMKVWTKSSPSEASILRLHLANLGLLPQVHRFGLPWSAHLTIMYVIEYTSTCLIVPRHFFLLDCFFWDQIHLHGMLKRDISTWN